MKQDVKERLIALLFWGIISLVCFEILSSIQIIYLSLFIYLYALAFKKEKSDKVVRKKWFNNFQFFKNKGNLINFWAI